MIKEIQSPCAQCDFKYNDKRKNPCKECIEEGNHLKYCMELGGLTESLPVDVILVGYAGKSSHIKKTEKKKAPIYIKKIIVKICHKYNVSMRNVEQGFIGNAFSRARYEIIRQYLNLNLDLDLEELSLIIGISIDEIEAIVDRIENLNEKNKSFR